MESIAYHGHTLRRWRVGPSTFLALPERGARLMNWNLQLGDGSIRDVIYWPEAADFSAFAQVRGGNPVLFPFSGRCFDAGEPEAWRAPDGARRPMPRHGFARQGSFRLVWHDARGFTAQLEPDAAAQAAYPFSYEFAVTYRFEPCALTCEFTLKNLGGDPLPWSPGHHFYFTLPWSEAARREDYLIRIPATERLRSDSTGGLQPGPQLKEEERLSEPALVDAIHTRLRSNEVRFGERGRAGDIVLQLGTTRTPPPDAAVVTWTTEPAAPFYCVEPWMGPPNAPSHGRGLHWVPPRETGTFSVRLAVQ